MSRTVTIVISDRDYQDLVDQQMGMIRGNRPLGKLLVGVEEVKKWGGPPPDMRGMDVVAFMSNSGQLVPGGGHPPPAELEPRKSLYEMRRLQEIDEEVRRMQHDRMMEEMGEGASHE